MKVNRFNQMMNPNKRPIPRDLPLHAHNVDQKYRIHKVGDLWYLCDTVIPYGQLRAEARYIALHERRNNLTRLFTMDGRECTDVHESQYGFSDYDHARAAYLSQIS